MFEIITAATAAHRMAEEKDNGFSYAGALALIEFLDETSDLENGVEFDPIGFRCEYTEYETAIEAINEQSGEEWEGTEQEALEKLQDITTVIIFEGGIIVLNY